MTRRDMMAMAKRADVWPTRGVIRVISRGRRVLVVVDDLSDPQRAPFLLGYGARLSDALIDAGERARWMRLTRAAGRAGKKKRRATKGAKRA